ncbi:lytic polysaccharide monooxygenase [Streptomyces rubradiris]|uniref:Chitin-binding protein n=1 Tax=Streptomyces rubradiris TaxID=285531 RepID=A0ABQ3R6G1_STRRR|nr:lytic polysaccharide monooxygenase [Streptomyces rubradiris]GHH13813.1 chitin-binding protein [Streptomyces rubradiris]GHI51424.1 chitin-binding protein [Streptomyces rubradiris]
MPSSRKATASAVTVAALGLSVFAAWPAAAHGTMGDPVSRVAQCYAEGPESPESAACEAAVAAGGTQALYDWNGIRIGDAAGRHRQSIPDGRLCSAGNEEFKGLDLARADWPATRVHGGSYTFKYRVTASHKGTFTVYATKPGYDPAKRLAWADLDLEHPVAEVTDPVPAGGFYTFTGTLPERSGRHLLYAVWQRSDSPEAFYSCSDVDFGGAGDGSAPAPSASAPSEEQIAAGAGKSTVEHHGHGDDDAHTSAEPAAAAPAEQPATPANRPEAEGGSARLAETGASAGASSLAVGGAAALAVGSAALFLSVRRRAAGGGRRR